jgi:glycosyltransferase involved in cell wall biosynthesis
MKILLVQDHLRSGGTERQSILLTRAFAAAGHDATLLTFRSGGALAATASGLRTIALQQGDTGLDWFAPRLTGTAQKAQPDVVLCMGRMANCYGGRLQAKLPRAAVVCTMRTGKKLPWLFRRSLRLVRHVVANSHEAETVLIERYAVPARKISVIHNALVFGADNTTDGTAHTRESLRKQFGATAQTAVLLCVAMFRPEKNQRELIELVAQLPRDASWQLWLAGEGIARAACETFAREKGLTERVKFLGFHADPRPLYRAADIAVLTSRSESLSNFLIEAHAHGLPSVAYNVCGVAECGGFVAAPGDQSHFLASLTTLMTDATARVEAAAHVREFARENFSQETQIRAYLDLFAQLKPDA